MNRIPESGGTVGRRPRLRTGLLVVAAILTSAVAGGVVGGGAAVALVRSAYNGPVQPAALPEVMVNSEALGEPMALRVHLPMEYDGDPDRSFPELWVLDGRSQGAQVARTTRMLSRIGIVEPSIVVEVPATSRGRRADFTPPWEDASPGSQADRMLRFLEVEALPAVAAAYRVDGRRVLVGHSLGGLFALYALLQKPPLFDGYFVFSPSVWVADDRILHDLERTAAAGTPVHADLFVSLGDAEDNEMQSGFEALEAMLGSWSAPDLRWRAAITEGANHGTNPELSFPVAAQWYADQPRRP